MAPDLHAWKAVDFDLHRLAAAHVGELGFLVVGHDIDRVERHHRHQGRAGLDVLADPQRPRANRAGDRCDDGRVGQVELCLVLDRPAMVALRLSLDAFGRQYVDLALGDQQPGPTTLQLRRLFAQRRVGLLGALDGAIAGLQQIAVAGVVGLGERERDLGGGDVGLFLIDGGTLLGDLCVEIADRGLGGSDIGLCLIEGHTEISIVDASENLSRGDLLVVLDEDLGDVARDLRRNRREVGLHIGVVGRLQILADLPVVVAARRCGSEACHRHDAEAHALHRGF
jgi:hypothetical protein